MPWARENKQVFGMVMLDGRRPLKAHTAMYSLFADRSGVAAVKQSFGQTLRGVAAAEAPAAKVTSPGPQVERFSSQLLGEIAGAPIALSIPEDELRSVRFKKVFILGFSVYFERVSGEVFRFDSKNRYNSLRECADAFRTFYGTRLTS